MTSERTFNPAALATPSGYAHAMRVDNHVYLGGQTALDENNKIVPGGVVEQFRRAFFNVLESLREAGGQPEDLVSVTIYLTDVDDYQANGREIGRIWREMAGTVYPTMAGIGVSRLWQPEAVVEIQAIAVVAER